VITQNGKPIAFFSRKLNSAQQKYSVTELELLSIVECLKEFKGMLWGQRLRVFTDHKNLIQSALGYTCNRVYRWRLILEEYSPEILHISGQDNIVADAISRLDFKEEVKTRFVNVHLRNKTLVKFFNSYVDKTHGGELNQTNVDFVPEGTARVDSDLDQPRINYSGIRTLDTELYEPLANKHQVLDKFKYLFASSKTDENIYPVTISEISDSQSRHRTYRKYFKKKSFKNRDYKITPKVVTSTTVLVFDKKRLVIPTE
jgi:hypothetical protein